MHTDTRSAERRHDLYIRAGNTGFSIHNDNCGVTLNDERISWTMDGQDDGAPFKNIRSVHLQTGGDWRNPIGICRITFADGYALLVTDRDGYGFADDLRRSLYRAFVHDLHARLAALPGSTIRFTTGWQGFRYPLIIACGLLMGIICIVVPIAAMIKSGTVFGPFAALLAGTGLFWPLTKALEKNAPRSYDPRHPPEDLLE